MTASLNQRLLAYPAAYAAAPSRSEPERTLKRITHDAHYEEFYRECQDYISRLTDSIMRREDASKREELDRICSPHPGSFAFCSQSIYRDNTIYPDFELYHFTFVFSQFNEEEEFLMVDSILRSDYRVPSASCGLDALSDDAHYYEDDCEYLFLCDGLVPIFERYYPLSALVPVRIDPLPE